MSWGELRSLLTAAQKGGIAYASLYEMADILGEDAVAYCDRVLPPHEVARHIGVRLPAEHAVDADVLRRAMCEGLALGARKITLVHMTEGAIWRPSTSRERVAGGGHVGPVPFAEWGEWYFIRDFGRSARHRPALMAARWLIDAPASVAFYTFLKHRNPSSIVTGGARIEEDLRQYVIGALTDIGPRYQSLISLALGEDVIVTGGRLALAQQEDR